LSGPEGGPLDNFISMTPDQRVEHRKMLEHRLSKQTIEVKAEIVDAILVDEEDGETLEDLL